MILPTLVLVIVEIYLLPRSRSTFVWEQLGTGWDWHALGLDLGLDF